MQFKYLIFGLLLVSCKALPKKQTVKLDVKNVCKVEFNKLTIVKVENLDDVLVKLKVQQEYINQIKEISKQQKECFIDVLGNFNG
jgi:hypothetical protein